MDLQTIHSEKNPLEDFQVDIDYTVECILNQIPKKVSHHLLKSFEVIYPQINSTTTIQSKENLVTLLSQDICKQINIEYFKLFTPATQEFIMTYLSRGAQGVLSIAIDDSSRNWPNSNKEFTVTIDGTDIYEETGEEFQYNFEHTNLNAIESICKELSDHHYLGLGLEWGTLQSIVLYRPCFKTIEKKNKEIANEERGKIRTKTIKAQYYPRKEKA